MSHPATSLDETPFFVRAAGEDVFGIITAPTAEPRGVAAILLSGGAFVGATNRNRVSVRLARQLAEAGYHAVRMDYHGVGDSTGDFDTYALDRPFVEDMLAVVGLMQERGVKECVLVGTTCFGARTALAGASKVSGLRGVVLLATPLRDSPYARNPDAAPTQDYLKRAFSRQTLRALGDPNVRQHYRSVIRWKLRSAAKRVRGRFGRGAEPVVADGMSPTFYEPLAALATRGTPVLLGYGLDDLFYQDFLIARAAPRLAGLLDVADSRIEVQTVDGVIHALRRICEQDSVVSMIGDWLTALDARLASAA